MTTRPTLIFAFFLLPTVAFGTAFAQTYQWKDSNGQTVVSDVPPPPTVKGRRSIGGNQPSVVSEKPAEKPAEDAKAADAPKTVAEKDFEFKKRQQEAKEKADKLAKEQAAEADKRLNCDRARNMVTALEGNQPTSTYDNQGQRKLMDSAQREQELDRARRAMAESCK
jgi:hypothetical protein